MLRRPISISIYLFIWSHNQLKHDYFDLVLSYAPPHVFIYTSIYMSIYIYVFISSHNHMATLISSFQMLHLSRVLVLDIHTSIYLFIYLIVCVHTQLKAWLFVLSDAPPPAYMYIYILIYIYLFVYISIYL